MSGTYQIQVLDHSGNEVDLIPTDRLESLTYTRKVNDVSECVLTFSSDTDPAFDWYQNIDYLLEIRREENNISYIEGTYFLRLYDVAERNDRERLIVSGRSLEDLLRRRVINPNDDATGAGGFSTKGGNADAVMIAYVSDQCISPAVNADRTFTGLTAAPVVNVGNVTSQRLKQEDNLLTALQDIAYQTEMDFVIVRNSGAAFLFRPQFTGSNRTKTANYPHSPFLMFDVRRGNIRNPRLVVNRSEEVNFLYVAGQGSEEDRNYVSVPDSNAVNVSPWNRCEDTVDARNDEDYDALVASGYAELKENRAAIDLSFEPNLSAASVRYRSDWDLGDRVTASYRGFEEDLRITEVSVRVNSSGETIKPRVEHVRSSQ